MQRQKPFLSVLYPKLDIEWRSRFLSSLPEHPENHPRDLRDHRASTPVANASLSLDRRALAWRDQLARLKRIYLPTPVADRDDG